MAWHCTAHSTQHTTRHTTQHNTTQHNAQYSTAQHSTAQHSTAQYSTTYNTAQLCPQSPVAPQVRPGQAYLQALADDEPSRRVPYEHDTTFVTSSGQQHARALVCRPGQDRQESTGQDRTCETGHARQDMRDRTCGTGDHRRWEGQGNEHSARHHNRTGQDRYKTTTTPHHTTLPACCQHLPFIKSNISEASRLPIAARLSPLLRSLYLEDKNCERQA